MALTAKKVYAILKRQISDMEAKLNSPVRYRGTVVTADLLPLNPDIGDMYNIESKSIYGEAGMNVAWNGVVWDTMGAPIDMSLYIKSSELADWAKQPQKPDYTAEEVGALPANTKIPSKTSDLQNDSGFLTKIPDNYLSGTDKTLSASGKAADAKATGDKITELSADISNKLNKNQGSENSGKIAGINESGDIVPMFPVSVDYNEETNCLEFGSDQKMELNKGINLDSTLTKTGYAADAGAVGKITDSLKEDLVELTELSKISDFGYDSKYTGYIRKYEYPHSAFEMFGVNLFTDGRNFFHDFKIENHKNLGGTTYYLSRSGNNSNDGLTEATAKKSITSALMSLLSDGDTICILDGVYPRQDANVISKSINIVAKNPGRVFFVNSSHDFSYTHTSANIYQTNRSTVGGVLFKSSAYGYIQLDKKTSLEEVSETPFSFANVSGVLYLNLNGVIPNNYNTFVNVQYGSVLTIQPNGKDILVYIDGIKFIGGTNATVYVSNTATNKATIYANNCCFYGASGDTYDAISLLGCNGYFVNCECAYSTKDGFNYHAKNGIDAHGLEINCRGYCNGKNGNSKNNMNGSTQHSGYILRIGGVYHDNFGPNIADVYKTTKSLNIKCLAFDSNATEDASKADFMVQYDGAEMWCESCVANSGASKFNFAAIRSYTDELPTTMHLNRCKIGNKFTTSGGTYVETNN